MLLFLAQTTSFGANEPFDTPIGPMKERGPASGLITRHGYIVAEWGDPKRADITNSVTKTFLTTVVGLAWQRGLIKDVNDYARDYMPPHVDLFDAPHNQKIKWDHLLRQTSDWQGTLWGKPDWADRPEGKPAEWPNRKLWEPGSVQIQRRARERARAGGAARVAAAAAGSAARGSDETDRRFVHVALVPGYENSWVVIDGRMIRSVRWRGALGGAACSSTRSTWRGSATSFSATARGNWKTMVGGRGSDGAHAREPAGRGMVLELVLNTAQSRCLAVRVRRDVRGQRQRSII